MKDIEMVDSSTDNDERGDESKEESDRYTNRLSILVSSIHERISVFNFQLIDMAKERLSVKKVLICNDFYCTALERGAFLSQVNIKKQEELLHELRKVENIRKKVKSQSEAASITREELNSKVDGKTIEYRLLDTQFSKSIQKYSTNILDQETVHILFQLFIRRDITNMASFGDGACFVSANDPFWEGQHEHSNTYTSFPTTDVMPDGFDTHVWEGMITLRKEKNNKERELVILRKELEISQDVLYASVAEEHILTENILHLQEEVEALKVEQTKLYMPPEFITSLQLEHSLTEEHQKVMSCGDILIVPTHVSRLEREKVLKYNEKRQELQEKIQNLENAVKQQKAQNEVLELRQEEAKGLLTQCRTLRVTSPIRRKLAGMEPKDETELERKAKNLTFKIKNDHDNKIVRLKQEKGKIDSSIEKKKAENEKLMRQMASLKKTAEQYDEEAPSTLESTEHIKMKKIMHQSRQMQTFRKLLAEISKLEDELKRLREKSFPSFSKFPER